MDFPLRERSEHRAEIYATLNEVARNDVLDAADDRGVAGPTESPRAEIGRVLLTRQYGAESVIADLGLEREYESESLRLRRTILEFV